MEGLHDTTELHSEPNGQVPANGAVPTPFQVPQWVAVLVGQQALEVALLRSQLAELQAAR